MRRVGTTLAELLASGHRPIEMLPPTIRRPACQRRNGRSRIRTDGVLPSRCAALALQSTRRDGSQSAGRGAFRRRAHRRGQARERDSARYSAATRRSSGNSATWSATRFRLASARCCAAVPSPGMRWKDGAPFDAEGPGTSDLDLTLVGGDALASVSPRWLLRARPAFAAAERRRGSGYRAGTGVAPAEADA